MRRFPIFLCVFAFAFNLFAREQTRLADGWKFLPGEHTNAAAADFNDADWPTVSIPHCWGWQEAQQGKPYYRGPGWYRRGLNFTPDTGKRYFLQFGAASTVADVYLNGKFLGAHRGGFGAFAFEITTNLAANGTNLLAVRVSNAKEPDVAPLDGDFSVYGGLYRPVQLLVTGEADFTPLDHGSPGVAWLQTSVSATQAVLDVTAQISNAAQKPRALTLVASVLDANGNRVAGAEENIAPVPGVTAPYFLRVVVPQPHLWNGRKDPYLYQAVVEMRSADGVIDSVVQPLGLRFYSVDPDKGFFLNGRPYHLHGVNRHQDRKDKGWAISEADMDEDLRLIQEMGCTAVRCAHYQHSDYFYSLCDRAGILVWAEIPQVNLVHDTPEFANTSRDQLLDLIRQDINHPSIFAWSLFNEIGSGSDDPHRELQDLRNLAHGEDPTRPVIAATCTEKFPEMNKIPDLLGWNIYPGWYSGTLNDYGKILDRHRHDSRFGGLCISEYGAGANVTQHEDPPRQPKPDGQWHPEEWQAKAHEAAWSAMKQRPFVWGAFVWNMFDFAVSTRHEGGQPGLNDKGLVTYDRKTRKDAFFFYKANWSEEPVLYITSRRFTKRTNAVTEVKVYSNAQSAELHVNGVSQGKRESVADGIFLWPNVRLAPGKNKIAVSAVINGQPVTDECVWTLKAD